MDIAAFSIRNRLIMRIVIVLSLFAGWMAYQSMPRFEDPEFTIRTARIFTFYPGGSPQEVAREVSSPLEEKLQDMQEVEEIRSMSTAGRSEITVDIKYSASPDKAALQGVWTKLRNKVRDAGRELPPGAQPSVVFDEFGDVFGIYYVLTGKGYSMPELRHYAKELRSRCWPSMAWARSILMASRTKSSMSKYRARRRQPWAPQPARFFSNWPRKTRS